MKQEVLNLINENKNLIYKIASRFSSYYDIEDLFQVGVIGIIEAYKKYDKNSNVKFSTYAYKYIFGEIMKYINNDRNIRISSDYFKIYKSYLQAKEALSQTFGRSPSVGEISLFMEIDEKLLNDVISASEFTLSLDSEIDDSISLENICGVDQREEVIDSISLEESIKELPEEEQKIIDLRYYQDYSQGQTAKILGISQAKVSRKESYALKLIKRNIV
ncbi:MAG: sigma-70 family RNA polymerase sigma factor [Bacilli bacterium]|nr:sigma-70 family RNA polymerase sigma factor [Bacilli bacterium]